MSIFVVSLLTGLRLRKILALEMERRGNITETESATALQEEVRQLKRTLDIRKSEIALTSRRVQDLESLLTATRETSMASTDRARALNTLEVTLQEEVERGARLQAELARVQEAIAQEDAARTKTRAEQLKFFNELIKVANEMLQITNDAVVSDAPYPKQSLAALTQIADSVVLQFDSAHAALGQASALYAQEVEQLQAAHSECVQSIRNAAEENIQQRTELEDSWKHEEQTLAKQLRDVRQRAREAAFHHHRGSGVVFDGSLEERKSIAERRVVHKECVALEQEIRKAEMERERERVESAKQRALLLGR